MDASLPAGDRLPNAMRWFGPGSTTHNPDGSFTERALGLAGGGAGALRGGEAMQAKPKEHAASQAVSCQTQPTPLGFPMSNGTP